METAFGTRLSCYRHARPRIPRAYRRDHDSRRARSESSKACSASTTGRTSSRTSASPGAGGKNDPRAAASSFTPHRGRRPVRLSQRLRRQRPDDRDPRVRRRLSGGRSQQILLQARHPDAVGHRGVGRRRAQRADRRSEQRRRRGRARHRGGRRRRAGGEDRRLLRAQHRRGIHQRAVRGDTRQPAPAGDRVDQLGQRRDELDAAVAEGLRRRVHRRRGAGHHGLRGRGRPRLERHGSARQARQRRLSGVVSARARLRRDAPPGQRHGDRRRDRVEHARRLGDRRRRQRDLLAARLSERRRRAGSRPTRAARPAAASPMSPATATAKPATGFWSTAFSRWSAAPARSRRCGRD